MPTSSPVVIAEVVNQIEQVPHETVLDVGPGFGKYGLLLREYLNVKPLWLVAVEKHAPYVDQFRWLDCVYDDVWVGDVQDLADSTLAKFDVVLMCDVIEHIDEHIARALLVRIPGRVVICTPRDFFQTDDGLPDSERHVSHWPEEKLRAVGAEIGREFEMLYTNHVGAVIARIAPKR